MPPKRKPLNQPPKPNKHIRTVPLLLQMFHAAEPDVQERMNAFALNSRTETGKVIADYRGFHQIDGEWPESTKTAIDRLKDKKYRDTARMIVAAAVSEENGGIYNFSAGTPGILTAAFGAELAKFGLAKKLTQQEVHEGFEAALPEVDPSRHILELLALSNGFPTHNNYAAIAANKFVDACWTEVGSTAVDHLGLHRTGEQFPAKTLAAIQNLKNDHEQAGARAMIKAALTEQYAGIYDFPAETASELLTSENGARLAAEKQAQKLSPKQFKAFLSSQIPPTSAKKRKAAEIENDDEIQNNQENFHEDEGVTFGSPPATITGERGISGFSRLRMESMPERTARENQTLFADLEDTLNGYKDALNKGESTYRYLHQLKACLTKEQNTLARVIEEHKTTPDGYFAKNDSENLTLLRSVAQMSDVLPEITQHPHLYECLEIGDARHRNEFLEGRLYLSAPANKNDLHDRYFFRTEENTSRWSLPRFHIDEETKNTAKKDRNGYSYIGARLYHKGGLEIFDPARNDLGHSHGADGDQTYQAPSYRVIEFAFNLRGKAALLSPRNQRAMELHSSHGASDMELDHPEPAASQLPSTGRHSLGAAARMSRSVHPSYSSPGSSGLGANR